MRVFLLVAALLASTAAANTNTPARKVRCTQFVLPPARRWTPLTTPPLSQTTQSLRGLQQVNAANNLAQASWSLAQDLPVQEGKKDHEDDDPHTVLMPRKEVTDTTHEPPRALQQQANAASNLAQASWSLAQNLPVQEGKKDHEDDDTHTVLMPRKEVTDTTHEPPRVLQQQASSSSPLAQASWSLAQNLPVDGKKESTAAAKQQEEGEEEGRHLQEQGEGSAPLANASWSLAQDLPINGPGDDAESKKGLKTVPASDHAALVVDPARGYKVAEATAAAP